MPSKAGFKNIGVAGVGLIGGSFAKAFAKNGHNVYGYDIYAPTVEKAALSGVFKGITDEEAAFLSFPLDLIYICMPVEATINFISLLGKNNIKTPVTDAASTKSSVVAAAAEAGLNFCGGHPIRGKETSGFENSESGLFENARHILTPEAGGELAEKLKILHEKIHMRVSVMEAKLHDDVFALVSHLPHLTSFCLMDTVSAKREEAFAFAGAGFLDFTRIAASDPVMWADIFIDNKDLLLQSAQALEKSLETWKNLIKTGNHQALKENIEKVSNIRRLL